MKNRKMFLVAINEDKDNIWISERTEEGFKAMDDPDFVSYPERWTEWKLCDSVENCLEKLKKELEE